ncbi:MAG: fibronectin type III domain-containing protein [Thermoplasmata archaeon]
MSLRSHRDGRRVWAYMISVVSVLTLLLSSLPLTLAGPPGAASPSPSATPSTASDQFTGGPMKSVGVTSVKNFTSNLVSSPAFYGVNVRSAESFTAADAFALKDTNTLTWRYPGGDEGETYNYTTNLLNTSSHAKEKNSVSNFVGLCVLDACRAILQLPAEIDDPATDAYFVHYIEYWLNYTVDGEPREGFTPWLWEFGNEPSEWTNFGLQWSLWRNTGVNATPTSYAAIVPSIIEAIRSVDQTTPIDPLGGIGGSAGFDRPWVYDVMSAAQTTVQFLSIHSYPEGSRSATSDAGFYSPVYSGSSALDELLPNLSATILLACANCTDVRLLVSESGASTTSVNPTYEEGFPMAMWDATEVIQSSAANASSIDFFAFLNSYPGSFMLTAPNASSPYPRFDPSYYLFKDITPFLGSTVLNVTLNNTDGGKLQVGGWRGSGNNWSLLLVNLDTQYNLTVTIAGSGFPVEGNIEYYTWNGSTQDPVGNATTWMNSTTFPPNSLELITVYPLAPVLAPSAPTGLMLLNYNYTTAQANLTFAQPPGPIVNDSIAYGTPTTTAPYCTTPQGNFSARFATAGIAVTGLNPNAAYCFAAQAWTTAGGGPLSNYVNVTTIYPPPTGLTNGTPTTTSVPLSWTRAPDTLNSTVYGANASAGYCGPYTISINVGTVDSWLVTGLTPGQAYCFTAAQWYTPTIESLPSAPAIVTMLPDTPTNVSASPTSSTSMLVHWTNPAGDLTNEYVFWQEGLVCSSASEVKLGAVSTSYERTGLAAGTQYCFYVEAVDSAGPSGPTPIVTNVTDRLPGIPEGLANGTVTTTTIPLSWTNPGGGGIVNDTLYQGPAGCEYGSAVSLGVAENATVSGLTPATSYCFAVQAWNSTGGSAMSRSVVATTLPVAPTDLEVVWRTGTSITVAWVNPVGTLTADDLFWETGSSCSPATEVEFGSVRTSATLEDLPSASTFCLYVEAVSAGGASAPSVSTTGTTLPLAPSSVAVTALTTTTVSLSWTNPPGALTDDEVFGESGTTCGSATETNLDEVAASYTATGLTSNTVYCFYVEAVAAEGNSTASLIVTARTASVPASPSSLRIASATGTTLTLAWSNPSTGGLLNNTIYYGSTCGALAFSRSTGGVVSAYNLTGLSPNTTYCVAVQVWNATGGSPFSPGLTGATGGVYPATYTVSFTESGLPAGTEWWVNLTDGRSTSSISTGFSFEELNGTFSYVVTTGEKTYAAAGGVFTVEGESVSVTVVFAPVTYSLSFTESGLAVGTNWSVTLGSETHSSTTSTIVFAEINATYAYYTPPVAGYTSANLTGTLTVSGAPRAVDVTFTETPPGHSSSFGSAFLEWDVLAIELGILLGVVALFVRRHLRRRREREPPEPWSEQKT